MPTAAHLRKQLESSLSARVPGALSPRLRAEVERIASGNPVLDGLLDGGLAVGVLTEFVGVECSGRTTMALAYAAAVARAGSVCAWIDVADSLDPDSAAANGVDLERMLWVRCGGSRQLFTEGKAGGSALATAFPASSSPAHSFGGGSPHPRSEGRDMPEAIRAMLHAHGGLHDRPIPRKNRGVGTPGAANRPLSRSSVDREEQVNSDRLPARRGDNLSLAPRCAEPQPRRPIVLPTGQKMTAEPGHLLAAGSGSRHSWAAIDQGLRAADLLLQGGGFSVIVLDLGGTPPEAAWRIPLSTWFRFRAACERSRVSLLLLTQHACARSSAELVVRLEAGSLEFEGGVMKGAQYQASTERSRSHPGSNEVSRIVSIRKPPQPERPGRWRSRAAWAQSG